LRVEKNREGREWTNLADTMTRNTRYPITPFTTEEYKRRWGCLLVVSALVIAVVGWLFMRASGPLREWPAGLPGPVYLTFGPNNTLLIPEREMVTAYDIESGEAVDTLTRPEPIRYIATSDNGRFLVTVEATSTLTLWSLPGYQQLATVPRAATCGLFPDRLAISPDGSRLAWFTGRGCALPPGVTVWDAHSQQVVQSIVTQGRFFDLQFSLDGQSIALLGNPFELYDIASGSLRYRLEDVQAVSISPDQRWLVCLRGVSGLVGPDALEVRQFGDGQLVRSFVSRTRDIDMLAVSPNNRYLATTYQPGGSGFGISYPGNTPIAVRSMETGARVQEFEGHEGGASELRFTSDGRYLVSYGPSDVSTIYGTAIRLWWVAPYPAWVRWLWLWLPPALIVAALLRGLWLRTLGA
jgi:WD40 repeat protein